MSDLVSINPRRRLARLAAVACCVAPAVAQNVTHEGPGPLDIPREPGPVTIDAPK